jgi:hypothetical protein
MSRTKLFLLILTSAFALAGPAAPVAHAEAEFRSATYPATISIEQTSTAQLVTKAGTVKCKVAKASGTLSASSPELTVTPSFGECTLAGVAATPETKGTLVLKGGGGLQFKSTIAFKAKECTVTVTEQTLSKGLTYGETEPGFTIAAALTGVAYTTTAGCSGGAGSSSSGEYSGSATASGNAGQIKVGKTTLCKVGNPVNCPVGDEFTEKTISGSLESPATWSLGAETITCGESAFTAELSAGGLSAKKEGITKMTFNSNKGADCTSNLPGTPKVTVSVESLPYDATQAMFGPSGAFVGTFSVAKDGATVQIKLAIHFAAGDTTCVYRPTAGLVAGWINATGGALSKAQFLNQAFSLVSSMGGTCVASPAFSAVYRLSRGGGNDIFLSVQ